MGCRVALPVAFVLVVLTLDSKIGVAAAREEDPLAADSTSSPWLASARHRRRPRGAGCWHRPWLCREPLPPLERVRLCCRNRCVDIVSDANNCGLCGIRCPFRWRCCNGLCVDVVENPFHCGDCGVRCPLGSLCLYGLCGYGAARVFAGDGDHAKA